MAVSSTDPDILLAATLDSPGPVTGYYPSSHAGIYKSVDGGESWTRTNCGFSSSRVNSIRFASESPDIAVARVEGGEASFDQLKGQCFNRGLYVTTDGGESWSSVAIDENDGRNGFWHLRARGSDPTSFYTFGMYIYGLEENHGFLQSFDSGDTWSKFTTGFTSEHMQNYDVSSDETTIYAVPRDSFAILISNDSCANWTSVSYPRANGSIAISSDDRNRAVFASSYGLYITTNGLSSWPHIMDTDGTIEDIAFSPSDPNIVYAGATGLMIYKSVDGGQIFGLISSLRDNVINAGL